jgi:hypothetical protein
MGIGRTVMASAPPADVIAPGANHLGHVGVHENTGVPPAVLNGK